MIDFPPDNSGPPPFHLTDTLISDGQSFQKWDKPHEFDLKSLQLFQLQNTNQLEQSVGCLLQKAGDHLRFIATAFIVQNLPQPSNLVLEGNPSRPIKGLLLTAAHVFSSPLSFYQTNDEIFFTLSPETSKDTLETFSKFRVERLLSFNPADHEVQIEPITGYEFMVPQDLELLAIFEGDPAHQFGVNGNDFQVLKYQPLKLAQSCVIVGFLGRLEEKEIGSCAPILGRNNKLEDMAIDICRQKPQHSTRVFSTGRIIGANKTCVAVNCSTAAGFSGGPICIPSEDGRSFSFCGIYNGAAAAPFQALVSKILFRMQGKQVRLEKNDIPKIQGQTLYSRIQNELLWAEILRNLLLTVLMQELRLRLELEIKSYLFRAEKIGINVEHNLGVCGGNRFGPIIGSIANTFKIQGQDNQLFNFNGLMRFNANTPFVQKDVRAKLERFQKEGINGKRKIWGIFTVDAFKLLEDLQRDLGRFIEKISGSFDKVNEKKVERKFQKLLRKFSKIFEIWMTSVNYL